MLYNIDVININTMADDFNQHDAENRHYEQMRRLKDVRDALTRELDFYYDYVPKGESEEREARLNLRDRLASARDRLDGLVRDLY